MNGSSVSVFLVLHQLPRRRRKHPGTHAYARTAHNKCVLTIKMIQLLYPPGVPPPLSAYRDV